MAFNDNVRQGADYQLGAFALFVSSAAIIGALGFEHLGGYAPCPLCLMQRYAYYAAIPALFLALLFSSSGARGAAATLFFLVALAFVVNAGIGIYHAGAEWKFWAGPDSCAGGSGVTTDATSLLKDLTTVKVVRCDEASWRMLGLSFAGWSAVICLFLAAVTSRAGFAAAEMRRRSL
jgi:disulfide bond formation protein DsbB